MQIPFYYESQDAAFTQLFVEFKNKELHYKHFLESFPKLQ